MRMKTLFAVILTTAACGLIGAAGAQTQAAAKPAKSSMQCFNSRDWEGWRPAADSKAIYLRVNIKQIWRVDFASACSEVNDPAVHLVTKTFDGSVCDALDLDIRVSDGMGMSMPCFVSGITKLSDAEIKALPKDQAP